MPPKGICSGTTLRSKAQPSLELGHHLFTNRGKGNLLSFVLNNGRLQPNDSCLGGA